MTCHYAKPDQTYREHVDEAYQAWQDTIKAKKRLIERMSLLYDFPVERFLKGSLLALVLHDLGKMTTPFQEMMAAIRERKKFNYKRNYRHELISFVFTAYAALGLDKQEGLLTQIPVEALAVAGHHRPLNVDLTFFERESMVQKMPGFTPGGYNEALDIAKEIFTRHGWCLPEVIKQLEKDNPYNRLASLVEPGNNILGKLLDKDSFEKARDIYILMKGILHYADWHASGRVRVNYSVSKKPHQLEEDLARRCSEKGIAFNGFRPFQSKMASCSGHLLAVAPTGSGKTEGSILWALKNLEEMGSAKIIYLLPTMNTANQIYQRLSDIFGEENVGLTHSTANLFLQNDKNDKDEDEEDRWVNRRDILFHQSFMKPVTVGTIDQWLTSGFNAGRWILKEINATNAVIILDEIHSYDGWTLGLISSSIKHFAARGSRFLLMSATMPSNLINLFGNVLNDLTVIKDEVLLNASRSVYEVINTPIEEAEKSIVDAVSSGLKVLVVVNTVDRCQRLAKHFAELHPICYHSRFILKDRKRIEQKIENSNFVIATQVVEVSLDIDYDWLFTECAPPDAIAQRAGRVNRYRQKGRDSRVYIFRASTDAGKIYNPLNNPELLQKSFDAFKSRQGRLCEKDLIEIVEHVYEGYRIDETESYTEAVDIYRYTQKKRMAIFDNRMCEDKQEVTRQSKYDTISVIPYCFYQEVISLSPAERKWYEVKVPLWYFLQNKKIVNGLNFCEIKYDMLVGASLEVPKSEACLW